MAQHILQITVTIMPDAQVYRRACKEEHRAWLKMRCWPSETLIRELSCKSSKQWTELSNLTVVQIEVLQSNYI